MLVARCIVLDPRHLDSHPFTFQVVHQEPGHCVVSNKPHCVIGFGLLSFAWNIVLRDSLAHYIHTEAFMVSKIRTNTKTAAKSFRAMDLLFQRNFVLPSSMVSAVFDRTVRTDVRDMLLPHVKALWQKEAAEAGPLVMFDMDMTTHTPWTPFYAQCSTCLSHIVQRVYWKRSGASKAYLCVKCAKTDAATLKMFTLFGQWDAHSLGLL